MTVRPPAAVMPVPGVAADRAEPAVLAALVDTAVDGLALLADDGRYLWANPAACRILGLDTAPARASSGGAGRPPSGSGSWSTAPSR
jgi:hypothetical protein